MAAYISISLCWRQPHHSPRLVRHTPTHTHTGMLMHTHTHTNTYSQGHTHTQCWLLVHLSCEMQHMRVRWNHCVWLVCVKGWGAVCEREASVFECVCEGERGALVSLRDFGVWLVIDFPICADDSLVTKLDTAQVSFLLASTTNALLLRQPGGSRKQERGNLDLWKGLLWNYCLCSNFVKSSKDRNSERESDRIYCTPHLAL